MYMAEPEKLVSANFPGLEFFFDQLPTLYKKSVSATFQPSKIICRQPWYALSLAIAHLKMTAIFRVLPGNILPIPMGVVKLYLLWSTKWLKISPMDQ